MINKKLFASIKAHNSFLCVGLDLDISRLPNCISDSTADLIKFNQTIIAHTEEHCAAYKLNLAFYEALGQRGYEVMKETLKVIPDGHFVIADAKRGDIGNTAKKYAEAVFEHLDFDAITIAPYMGKDSVTPFLEYEDKVVILLALTSNSGSRDFQLQKLSNEEYLFERVLKQAQEWTSPDRLMFVIGATHPEYFDTVRKHAPLNFLLVPGIGHQGGDLDSVCRHGMNDHIGLLVNNSRAIIYAGQDDHYGEEAGRKAMEVTRQMERWIPGAGL